MSDNTNTFDPLGEQTPLTGRCLIEASAGTGKTYNLSALYIRLIAENVAGAAKEPSKIVVVTYTRAATKELRERITGRLRGARELLDKESGKAESNDPFLNRFKEHYKNDSEALKYLQKAFEHIDELSVHTIHGFAQRLLQEFGPQANIDFTGDVVTDDREITSELIYDYWRQLVSSADEDPSSRAVLHLVRDQTKIPEKFIDEYSDLLSDTSVELEKFDWLNLEEKIDEVLDLLPSVQKDMTDKVTGELLELFDKNEENSLELYKNPFKPPKKEEYAQYFQELDQAESIDELLDLKWGNIKNIAYPTIHEKIKNAGNFEDLSLSDATKNWMEQLGKLYEAITSITDRQAAIIEGILAELQQQYFAAIDERDEYSYDDLLYKANEMIQQHESVRAAIRRKYPLSLIDEFQDTDPLQWAMFDKLYDEDEVKEKETLLCLIGDPKQSIYRFRGADVNAYLNARSQIPEQNRFTLNVNWRSNEAFVEALNQLWLEHDYSFYNEEIEYEKISVPEPLQDREPLIDDQSGLTWIVDEAEEASLNKGQATDRAAEITARHIKQTLQQKRNKNTERENRLKPGDIAILCGTNSEAALMKRTLFDYGLNSVQLSRDNVYESAEARELQLILEAAAEPSNAGRLRAAIGTQMLGARELLVELSASDELDSETQQQWETWLDRAGGWHERWQRDGFTAMMRQMMQQGRCIENLLRYHDGERRVTNLRHLTDLLQEIARERPGEIQYLVHELRRRRQNAGDRQSAEEEELRLESDRDLINIVTVHRSKGLEYPVVYSPFLWKGINVSSLHTRRPYTYHDSQSDDPSKKRIDIDGDQYEDSKFNYFCEEFEDKLRTTYVALTRGEHHNILVHVPYNNNYEDSGDSAYAPIDYVLLGKDRYERALNKKFGEFVDAEETQFIGFDEIVDAIESLERDAGEDEIALQRWSDDKGSELEETDEESEDQSERLLEFREFADRGRLRQRWTIQSYSGLRRGVEEADSALEIYNVQMDEEGRIEGEGDEGESFLRINAKSSGEQMQEGRNMKEDAVGDSSDSLDSNEAGSTTETEGHYSNHQKEGGSNQEEASGSPVEREEGGSAPGEEDNTFEQEENVQSEGPFSSGRSLVESAQVPTMYTFPAGARTGLCWHRIYEEISFNDPDSWKPEIERQLAAHGFDPQRWADVLYRHVQTTLQKPLQEAGGVQLAQLKPDKLRKEMEFYFGYGQADVAEIMEIIRPNDDPPANQPLLEGLMNGYIDLTFEHEGKVYMLDYKSNQLGTTTDDYRQDALADSIREHYYDLQYHLYTLALHRYLKQRVGENYRYGTHYGGVFYLYLRGIEEGESENGIYFDRPEDEKIKTLEQYF